MRIVSATRNGDTETVAGHSVHRHVMIFPCHPFTSSSLSSEKNFKTKQKRNELVTFFKFHFLFDLSATVGQAENAHTNHFNLKLKWHSILLSFVSSPLTGIHYVYSNGCRKYSLAKMEAEEGKKWRGHGTTAVTKKGWGLSTQCIIDPSSSSLETRRQGDRIKLQDTQLLQEVHSV